jgi:hypothetical protein
VNNLIHFTPRASLLLKDWTTNPNSPLAIFILTFETLQQQGVGGGWVAAGQLTAGAENGASPWPDRQSPKNKAGRRVKQAASSFYSGLIVEVP